MKKFLSLVLSICLLFSVSSTLPFSALGVKIQNEEPRIVCGDYEYKILNGGTAEITSYTGSATNLIIPSKIDGYTVISIGYSAFILNRNLVNITVPNKVTNIENAAFIGCKNLISITLSEGIRCIGDQAFESCTSLTNITLPNTITSIGTGAFAGCTSLPSITIPASVKSIDGLLFCGCTNLKDIEVDKDNQNYSSLNGILYNKSKSLLLQYPMGKNDKTFTTPKGVKGIEIFAFWSCNNLTSVSISNDVLYIDGGAFERCKNLLEIQVDNNNTNYSSLNGDLYNKSKTTLIKHPMGKTDETFAIPSTVTDIDTYAFSYCESLKSITIPSSVTDIGVCAFEACTNLTSVVLPKGVNYIDDYAFWYCTNLADITIPNSVTSIGYNAFYNCTKLKDVYYKGSKNQWNSIFMVNEKSGLQNTNIHYIYLAVKNIKVNKTSTKIYNGKKTTLKATVDPNNATDKAVSWKSFNTKIATVTQNGVVKGIKPGTVAITATSKDGTNKSAVCTITVKAQKATKLTLSKKSVTLAKKGKTATVKATLSPSNTYNKNIAVTTSNKKVAKISSSKLTSGKTVKITAVKRGSAKIKFTAKDGSKKSAICKVTVKK